MTPLPPRLVAVMRAVPEAEPMDVEQIHRRVRRQRAPHEPPISVGEVVLALRALRRRRLVALEHGGWVRQSLRHLPHTAKKIHRVELALTMEGVATREALVQRCGLTGDVVSWALSRLEDLGRAVHLDRGLWSVPGVTT